MKFQLPPSLDRRHHTIEDEVAFARSLTPEERAVVVASVCQAALRALNLNPKRERVMSIRDPYPQSTIDALRRLREQR